MVTWRVRRRLRVGDSESIFTPRLPLCYASRPAPSRLTPTRFQVGGGCGSIPLQSHGHGAQRGRGANVLVLLLTAVVCGDASSVANCVLDAPLRPPSHPTPTIFQVCVVCGWIPLQLQGRGEQSLCYRGRVEAGLRHPSSAFVVELCQTHSPASAAPGRECMPRARRAPPPPQLQSSHPPLLIFLFLPLPFFVPQQQCSIAQRFSWPWLWPLSQQETQARSRSAPGIWR